jgi:hypothetical protein
MVLATDGGAAVRYAAGDVAGDGVGRSAVDVSHGGRERVLDGAELGSEARTVR